MAMFGVNDKNSMINYGNRNDFCMLCAREIKAKDRDEYAAEKKKLVGKLEGQPVVKFNQNGQDNCICKEHIKKLYEEMFAAEETVPETEEDKTE